MINAREPVRRGTMRRELAPKFTKEYKNGKVVHAFNVFELPTKSNPDYSKFHVNGDVKSWSGTVRTFSKLLRRFLTNSTISESKKLDEIKTIFRVFDVSDLAKFVIHGDIQNLTGIDLVKRYIRNSLRRKFKQNIVSVLNLSNGGGRFRYASVWDDVSTSGVFNNNELKSIAVSSKMRNVMPHVYNQYANYNNQIR